MALAVSACAEDEADYARRLEAVQQIYGDLDRYELVQSQSTALQARASVAIQYPSGIGQFEFRSCGATFISPHYAVTASHCVEPAALGGIIVTHVSARFADPQEARTLGTVTGSWPNWNTVDYWDATSISGYNFEDWVCTIYCGRAPSGASQVCLPHASGLDVALVHCPGRPQTGQKSGWVPVATTNEAIGNEVEVWWYHEYLDLPITNTGERYFRYGNFDYSSVMGDATTNNFRYTFPHLLWPLNGRDDASGAPAEVYALSYGFDTDVTQNSLFACHGTSGSGVFQRGSTYLHGPTLFHVGWGSGSPSTVCGEGMAPLKNQWTRDIEQLAVVQNNR